MRLDHSLRQRPTQPGHQRLQGVTSACRRFVAPDCVHELSRGNQLAGGEGQLDQQRAEPGAGHRNEGTVAAADLERPQHPDPHLIAFCRKYWPSQPAHRDEFGGSTRSSGVPGVACKFKHGSLTSDRAIARSARSRSPHGGEVQGATGKSPAGAGKSQRSPSDEPPGLIVVCAWTRYCGLTGR